MRRMILALVGCCAILTMGAASPGPPKWLVDHVREEINDDRSDPGSPPPREPSPRMFKRVDINGDKIADWKVDFQNEAGWCGTGGCRIELWLGRPQGGLTPVWEIGVREFRLKSGKTGATVDVDFHGSACGGAGVQPCPRRYVWDISEGAFLPALNKKGDGFLAGLPIAPVDLNIADAPEAVKTQANRLIAACEASGGKLQMDGVEAGRLPDLNGDGVREWYVGAEYPDCSFEVAPPADPLHLVVLVSAPDGGYTPAWETSDASIAFDISSRPATMFELTVQGGTCGIDSAADCPRRPLRWNPETRKLEPARPS